MAEQKRGPGRPKGSTNKKTKVNKKEQAEDRAEMQAGTPVDSAVRQAIYALILIALGVFFAIATLTHVAGVVGAGIGDGLKGLFGAGALILPFLLILYGVLMFTKISVPFHLRSLILIIILFLMVDLVNAGRFVSQLDMAKDGPKEVFDAGVALQGGGLFGEYAGYGLYKLVGIAGLYLIAILVMVICVMLLVNTPMSRLLEQVRQRREARKAGADREAGEKEEGLPGQMEMPKDPKEERARRREERRAARAEKKAQKEETKRRGSFRQREEEEPDQKIGPSIHLPQDDSSEDPAVTTEPGEKKQTIYPGLDSVKQKILHMVEKEDFGTKSEPTISKRKPPQGKPETKTTTDEKESDGTRFVNKEGETIDPNRIDGSETEIGGKSVATATSDVEKSGAAVSVTPKSRSRYKLPSLDLLAPARQQTRSPMLKQDLQERAALLEQTLSSFGVEAKVVNVISGPSVTRYEIEPARGVKVSRITNLADDIALSMMAQSIRIEAPIPGKAAVGIEIENEDRQMVGFREIVGSTEFRNHKSKLAFTVGRDIGGKPIVADLAKMPHLLIAGATGSGKSVCLNTIIGSILYKARPEEVKLILIDPKAVEMGNYNGIPHLLIPVVTDPSKAASALNWAVAEMTERYKKFAKTGVRDIGAYNQQMRDQKEKDEILPQIVIVIDELADLMMVASSQVEDAICRLAQLARAAGMHLVVATQRPSVDVVTGLIKANMPSRIALMVSSQIDSRTIIDMPGAEKLVGNGDMLFKPQDLNKPKRIQGPYISDQEVESIINHVKEQVDGEAEYSEEVIEQIEKGNSYDGGGDEEDELLMDAMEVVVGAGSASVSMLQRRFRIGYNRAARIIDMLEERGIISPADGTKPRQVLMTEAELEQMKEERA